MVRVLCDESLAPLSFVELKARSLASSREDVNFLTALRHSATVKTGEFPPAALTVVLRRNFGAVSITPIPFWTMKPAGVIVCSVKFG